MKIIYRKFENYYGEMYTSIMKWLLTFGQLLLPYVFMKKYMYDNEVITLPRWITEYEYDALDNDVIVLIDKILIANGETKILKKNVKLRKNNNK